MENQTPKLESVAPMNSVESNINSKSLWNLVLLLSIASFFSPVSIFLVPGFSNDADSPGFVLSLLFIFLSSGFLGIALAVWFKVRNNLSKISYLLLFIISFSAVNFYVFGYIEKYESENLIPFDMLFAAIGMLAIGFVVFLYTNKFTLKNLSLAVLLGVLVSFVINAMDGYIGEDVINSMDRYNGEDFDYIFFRIFLYFFVSYMIIGFGLEFIVNGFFNKSEKIKL